MTKLSILAHSLLSYNIVFSQYKMHIISEYSLNDFIRRALGVY
jgi:hypothetical protein